MYNLIQKTYNIVQQMETIVFVFLRWLRSPPQILQKTRGRLPLDISLVSPSSCVTGFLFRWLLLALF